MKKTFTGIVALLAGASAVHSQGWVSFGNYAATEIYTYVSLGSAKLGGSASGPPPTTLNYASETGNGNDWTVTLYGNAGWNDSPNTLTPVLSDDTFSSKYPPGIPVTATLEDGSPLYDQTLGTWYSVELGDIPRMTGAGPATVQLYAWYNDGGLINSYSAAVAFGVPSGFSATANIYAGGPEASGPNGVPAALPSFGTIELVADVPEPSTIALAVFGASAFLLRFRRNAP